MDETTPDISPIGPDAAPDGSRAPRLVSETRGLVAESLGKRFKNRPVLRDVSLTLDRGEAVAVRGDRRLKADVLVAHFKKGPDGASRVHEIEAFDNVLISSPEEIVRAEYGIYNVETGIATLTGSVKITRGDNQLNGERARVDLNTGVSTLLGGAQGVRGFLSPGQVGKREPRMDR